MKRTIWFWLCFIIATILAIYFSVRIVMTGMGHTATSYIRNIYVSADTPGTDLSSIVSAAAISSGTETYSIDLDAINMRISSVPGVRQSAVRRLPNGNISIHVSLHTTVALWTDGIHYYPLSADGTIVNTPTSTRNISDILFRGDVPSDISDIAIAAHRMIGHIDYMEWIENRRWNIHTNGGITILLPEHNPIHAIDTLLTINKNHSILSKSIDTIDMRDDARILIR